MKFTHGRLFYHRILLCNFANKLCCDNLLEEVTFGGICLISIADIQSNPILTESYVTESYVNRVFFKKGF